MQPSWRWFLRTVQCSVARKFTFLARTWSHVMVPTTPQFVASALSSLREFVNTSTVACRFGLVAAVSAKFVSDSLILCESPAHAVTNVEVDVTMNGIDFYPTNQMYEFKPPPKIEALWPVMSHGYVGTTVVSIFGSGFRETMELACIFDNTIVHAAFVMTSSLVCQAPPHHHGLVAVRVTVNGMDLATGALDFLYVPEASIVAFVAGSNFVNTTSLKSCLAAAIKATTNKFMSKGIAAFVSNNGLDFSDSSARFEYYETCDPGHFCDGFATMLCPNGTVCYVCPDHGMTKPVVCPAGFVCDKLGLRMPTTYCPSGHYCLEGTKTARVDAFVPLNETQDANWTGLYFRDYETGVVTFDPTLRSWPYRWRPSPATGASRVEHPPESEWADDAWIVRFQAVNAEQPFPCPPGHYCRAGVSTMIPIPLNFSTPQRCYDGHFCPRGSASPEGTGPCPTAGFICAALGLSIPVLTCPEGYWCAEGTLTMDPSDPIIHRPMPCPPGTFCLGGVAHNMTIAWIPSEPAGLSAPQTCIEGTFCREATPTTSGSNKCFHGHYCPPGTSSPIQVPLGSFSSDTSSVAPTMCFPGTYAPLTATFECSVCPAGYACQGYGTYEPEICPAGKYRSLADSVTCRLCPTGTYSIFNGSTDISQCLPCPEGRVCGEQGMTDLGATNVCPEGYACGVGTDRSTMFLHKCPAGHYCGWETTPAQQYNNTCTAGYYLQYFCPQGTSNDNELETRCPYFTTSASSYGQSRVTDCLVESRYICDKQNNTEHDPFAAQRYYRFLNYTVLDGSGTRQFVGGNGVGEIGAVASVNPINTSGLHENYTLPNWRNETVEIFRSCPEYVADTGGTSVTVVGRNFYESSLAMCRFTACNYSIDLWGRRDPGTCELPGTMRHVSERSVEVPARFVSETRVVCDAPAFDFDDPWYLAQTFKHSCLVDGDGDLVYLQPCAESSSQCTVHCSCDDDDDDCVAISGGCDEDVEDVTSSYGFRPVSTMVVELTEAEKAMERELVRGPDWRDTDREEMRRWNPCYSSEVAVDVTNNGKIYSSALDSKDALRVNVSEYYSSSRDDKAMYIVPGTWAVMTYLNIEVNGAHHAGNFNSDDVLAMDVGRCNHTHVHEEGEHDREQGWYLLRGLESAMLSFDLQHLPEDMVYYEHYRLAIFVQPSRCDDELCDTSRAFLGPEEYYPCKQPVLLPEWFNTTTTPKNLVFNMTLLALDDVIFKVEFHILHGLWLATAPFFENTATVQILTPLRARSLNQYTQNMLREQERLRTREKKKPDWSKGGKIYERDPVGKKLLRRQLSPYVSFEERDTEKFYVIGVVYNDNDREAARPLNLPPRYKDYERGRVLVSFNTTKESEIDVPTVLTDVNEVDATWFDAVQSPYENFTAVEIDRDVYFETFWYPETPVPSSTPGYRRMQHQIDKYMQGNVAEEKFILLPYLPFFSNCREWDSYLAFSSIVESDQCKLPPESDRASEVDGLFAPEKRYRYPPLPHLDDVTAVKAPDIFSRFDAVPIADWCEREIECAYEETDLEADENPVWFQASDGATLFYFLKEPVSYLEYLGRKAERVGNNHDGKMEDFGGSKIVYERAINTDELIPVQVSNEDQACESGSTCFPVKMVLEIGYKQRVTATWKEKQIIFANLIFTEFSANDATDTNYTLAVSYHPLDYIDLIIWFAFEQKVFLGIFIFTGCVTVVVSMILWVVVRITTTLENPPRLRLWSMLLLIAAPPLSGVVLALVPIVLALILVTILIRSVAPSQVMLAFVPGNQVTTIKSGIIVETIAGYLYYVLGLCEQDSCLDGSMPVQWSDAVSETDAVNDARSGRLGLAFLVMGFMCWYAGCRLFLPDRVSKRELEIQKRRTKEAEKEDIWKPTLWKRSNLMFSSFMVGLLCCVVCEFSYWEEFGTYIWFIIMGFRPMGQFLGAIVDNQLQDALLSAPIMTSFDVTTSIVTLSADNFVDFILSYFIELGMGLVETVYFNPGLSAFLEWLDEFTSTVKTRIIAKLPKWVTGRIHHPAFATAKTQAPDAVSDDHKAIPAVKRDVDNVVAEGGETVEPILDAFGGYSAGAMTYVYNIFVLELLIAYREEVQMPILYDIKNQDMLYYLLFAVVMIPFQFLADVFTLSVLELYHGEFSE
ncbi:hypothetical protein CTAYLR_006612 [Chrysophaeum taylorii]|uniref:IPT/TIG domain-containing protein n=1 Tax=Chrysophaeum taylorii TaxID=2483200 RepID=A0AAD7UL55_9STRA|nr:hypothetical protein CTAYLR_006612 [Chrysophaeum taylorii]